MVDEVTVEEQFSTSDHHIITANIAFDLYKEKVNHFKVVFYYSKTNTVGLLEAAHAIY